MELNVLAPVLTFCVLVLDVIALKFCLDRVRLPSSCSAPRENTFYATLVLVLSVVFVDFYLFLAAIGWFLYIGLVALNKRITLVYLA